MSTSLTQQRAPRQTIAQLTAAVERARMLMVAPSADGSRRKRIENYLAAEAALLKALHREAYR